ncbi:TraB/GumN family protein [Shewanella sp. VB17]|uniref:TraB/GumN family protein n=1 Tax=Shewanella sp. VB17 TaxID=2739432 RepID=UPI001567A0C2|nr:TraB/GumN family protein [Shewanella sp. VB17]NRD75611.1 TraB/GumN family protein [Shewanella sp. VB17]
MATSQLNGILIVIWVFLLTSIFSVQALAGDKPPFYQIEYKGKKAYLLGSIHMGIADFYPMDPIIESLFNSAESLVVEADIANVDINALISKYGLKPVTADVKTQMLLDDYCHSRREMCSAVKGFSPWLQSMQFGVARFEALGYSAAYGVEQQFIAKNNNKPLLELESTEFQFQLMSSFSDKVQWKMVKETIEAPDAEMHDLVNTWRRGDEVHLSELMEGQMIDEGDLLMIEKVLWQRNQQMATKIHQLMGAESTPQPMFIIVGAGHVVGSKSIVKELIKEGVKVKNCWDLICS